MNEEFDAIKHIEDCCELESMIFKQQNKIANRYASLLLDLYKINADELLLTWVIGRLNIELL